MNKRLVLSLFLMLGMLGIGYLWGSARSGSEAPSPAPAASLPSDNKPGSSAPNTSDAAPGASSDSTPRSTSPTLPTVPGTSVNNNFSNIRVTAPVQNSIITSPVTVKGQARVFEAQFKIVIQDGQTIIAEQQVHASAGAPEWGNFEVKIPLEQPKTEYGQIIFYTMSPKDGAPIVQSVWPVRFKD